MNKPLFTLITIFVITLLPSFSFNIKAADKSLFDTLIPSRKNCNYVDNKLYQPFSDIDKTFPGASTLGLVKSEKDPSVTCINVASGTQELLKMLFTTAISIIIILTVINISVSGIQYMTQEAVGKKGEAKKRLQNSFIALGLGILSYTILYTVNKQLVNFNFNPNEIDIDKSIDKGIASANKNVGSFSTYVGAIEALNQPVVPNSPYFTPGSGGTFMGTYGSSGSWNEKVAEDWIRGLPNGTRSTDGRLIVTTYSATKDKITDTNTAQKRGNANNLLREGSVALSPDLISKHKPMTGQEVFINGKSVGFYEDATAESYKGTLFTNTIDIYDENGSLGGSYLKNIPPGGWSISFGGKRAQITNK
jgi:hypothetical protein